jgi:hypothetical protein
MVGSAYNFVFAASDCMFMYEVAAFYFPQISPIGVEFRVYLRYVRGIALS